MSEKIQTTIRLKPEVLDKLKVMAAEQDLSVNQLVTRLLRVYFNKPSIINVVVK
jgi:predicted HicB family RNase H-like nuclease